MLAGRAQSAYTSNIPLHTLKNKLAIHIKMNLFHVSSLTVMFFMPTARCMRLAALLTHRDLTLCSAQRRAVASPGGVVQSRLWCCLKRN